MEFKLSTLSRPEWSETGIATPKFDIGKMRERTLEKPRWLHFGAGNIFRAFPAAVLQQLLEQGLADTGIVVAEGFDEEIIEKIYRPHDNLSLLVTLKGNGQTETQIIASVANAFSLEPGTSDYDSLCKIFKKESLQMVSFTITEKGYALTDASGVLLPDIAADFQAGPTKVDSYMGKVSALCYQRYQAGSLPIAFVSMDNFSHNGDRLKEAIFAFAQQWRQRGKVEEAYLDYLQDPSKVSFPWSMIDKITPRPDDFVKTQLKHRSIDGLEPIITEKHTYIAPFVNAEECQYLVIEDAFPGGRPPLEKGGIIFTDRETVDKVEKMKVCTCLNPLHTALAIFGCLLSYDRIHKEMENPTLKRLVEKVGYEESLPVVVEPGILNPKDFLDQVLQERFPNPYIPDTPQRIATDTSQKLPIRFGETIKAYQADPNRDPNQLKLIPLVFAGWCRYLMGIDDAGNPFEVSPDPLYAQLKPHLTDVCLGDAGPFDNLLEPILSNERIFGVNLYDAGLGAQVAGYFGEMVKGKGAVQSTLEKYVAVSMP